MAKAWLSCAAANGSTGLLQIVLHMLHHELVRQAHHLRLLRGLLLERDRVKMVISRGRSLV